MRTSAAVLVAFFVIESACGGGQATREAAQSPNTDLKPAPGAVALDPSAGRATTTTDVADTGGAPGTKLPEVSPGAWTSSSGAVPPTGGHAHDPGRGQSDIRAIVIAHKEEARACYDKALANHPGIEGDLVVAWTIDPKGNVVTTSLDTSRSQIVEPTVAACIEEIVKKIQFAPSPGGFETKATYPFNFHPHHGKAAP